MERRRLHPAALHNRYQHSLGVLRVVQDLFDDVLDNPLSRQLHDDLIYEWRQKGRPEFRTLVAESMVLARLGGLLHDFCHVPFGHTIEDDYQLLGAHDKSRSRFTTLWAALPGDVRDILEGDLKNQLELLILSKEERGGENQPPIIEPKYPFVLDLVGNTICADLIDYLWRDYYFTGLPGRLGRRFFSYFFITNSRQPDPRLAQRMALRIEKKGRLRADVISEVLKYLRYRYELSERALQHHAKVAADVMISQAVDLWIQQVGEDTVERALLTHGDDGLLEEMAASAPTGARELAAGVLHRRLHKEHHRSTNDATFARREELYGKWKEKEFRHDFYARLAAYLELEQPWDVLLSIPKPNMRLKAVDVLVSWGSVIERLAEWDLRHGHRVAELDTSHTRLWGIQLYVNRDLPEDQKDEAAAFVSRELRISWDDKGNDRALDPVVEQAVRELAREVPAFTEAKRTRVRLAATEALDGMMPPRSFPDLRRMLEASISEEGEQAVVSLGDGEASSAATSEVVGGGPLSTGRKATRAGAGSARVALREAQARLPGTGDDDEELSTLLDVIDRGGEGPVSQPERLEVSRRLIETRSAAARGAKRLLLKDVLDELARVRSG